MGAAVLWSRAGDHITYYAAVWSGVLVLDVVFVEIVCQNGGKWSVKMRKGISMNILFE